MGLVESYLAQSLLGKISPRIGSQMLKHVSTANMMSCRSLVCDVSCFCSGERAPWLN